MWKKPSRAEEPPADERFGVGVQVHVIDDRSDGALGWVGDPTGVIVASASGLAHGAFDIQRLSGRVWTIAFDEPQYRADGRGPFEQAEVPEYLLVSAPPAPASHDGEGEDA